MSLIVFQIVVKQWDKSQRSEADALTRNQIPDRYDIHFPPALLACNNRVLIDPHGDDRQKKRLRCPEWIDDTLIFDRFVLSTTDWVLKYLETKRPTVDIGVLTESWIQCRYSWRYRVFEGGQFYWLYEEVTLNAACLPELDAQIFLRSEPRIVYHDAAIAGL